MNKYKLIFSFFIVFSSVINVFSFVTFPKAVLTADKNNIITGDKVKVRVEILIPSFVLLLQDEGDILIDGWDIVDLSFKKDVIENDKYILDMEITTFDTSIKEIPQISFSYINKDDYNDGEKFFFFSNSIPVRVSSTFNSDEFKSIRDIKYPKTLSITWIYYIIAIVFFVYVIFFAYRTVLYDKILNIINLNSFTPDEIAIRKLNNLNIDENCSKKQIKEYYFVVSNIFKKFIITTSHFKKHEMTTTELLLLLQDKNNVFNQSFSEVYYLFESYDKAKYSDYMLNMETFLDIFKRTKKTVEKYHQSKDTK